MVDRGKPDLAVVVPSVNGWGDLAGCLRALEAQPNGVALEVIVADRVGEDVRERVRREHPEVRLLEAPAGTTIPRLREMAFGAARADVVGVIEDHVIVPPDWAERMLAEHQGGAEVVGGAVDNAARDRVVDWAAFLCEYSHCLVPPPRGPAPWLTGNNVTYRRALLERFRATIAEGGWENRLHDAMKAAGIALESRPDIVVGHQKHYTVGEYVHQRYLYSRSYAGVRVAGAGIRRRSAYGFAVCALPPLLFYRIVTNVLRTGRYRRELALSLPLLAIFVIAWAWGEAVGSWFGPGDALEKVR